jgi:regulator of protease activity HflC (stomatin/prohibitin superfamily)
VAVVRNGGPLDNRRIRQVMPSGSQLTWTGWFSQAPRLYPARHVQVLYTVTGDPARGDRSGVDVINVPTRDGVQVGIEGTVFLHFVGVEDPALLERFDNTYGYMDFTAADGQELRPWEGDAGFQAMLDHVFRAVLDNDLRQEVGNFDCAQLVASCGLIAQGTRTVQVGTTDTNASISEIQDSINASLESDLTDSLGASYFRDIRFRIAHVRLPGNVQTAVDDVQAKYAAVNSARAELRQARYKRRRNDLLGQTYRKSPELAMIDAVHAAPPGAQVIISAGGSSPGVNVGG